MKTLFCIIFSTIVLNAFQAEAQTKIESVSITSQLNKNNCTLRYYYYPNLEAYYDLQKDIYMYMQNGEWKTAKEIPSGYKGYSLNNKINVPINDYDDDNVLQFIAQHKKKYPYVSAHGRRGMTALASE